MSLYGALISGVSGLNANSTAMGIISDNITNMNAVGFKASSASFSSLVTAPREGGIYTSGGVVAAPYALVDQQGILQATSSATDLAISGKGFFTVARQPSAGGGLYFTRAGSFTADRDGNLVNAAGYYLQGVAAGPDGSFSSGVSSPSALRTINVSGLNGSPVASRTISLSANLQSSQTVSPDAALYAPGALARHAATGTGGVAPDFERAVQVFDSLGTSHSITFGFLKTANPNEWAYEAYSVPASDTSGTDGLVGSGLVSFDSAGNLASPATAPTINAAWTGSGSAQPVSPQAIAVELGTPGQRNGLGQVDAPSTLFSARADGNSIGNLTGVSINGDGVVEARFSNGVTRPVYRLTLATFPNVNGLSGLAGNVYATTLGSGEAHIDYAGTGTAGNVSAGSLEGSTVDLAREFTNMITTQRAYSASSKIISTSDEMLAELIQIKR